MSRIVRTAVAAVALLGASALLAACTPTAATSTKTASPVPSKTAPSKSAPPQADQSSPAAIEAVLTVAAVDVDGKNVTASGYVQGVVLDQGTCVYTFSGSGSQFTVEHGAVADRSTTSCGTVEAPIDRFQRGDYSVTVGMDVAGHSYTSEPAKVAIP